MDELMYSFRGNDVRTFLIKEEIWFIAKDVCDVLGIKNSRDAVSRLDPDETGVTLTDTPGGKQHLSSVNEYGLYSLILGSRKPEAREFKRWITHEVIPSIRKNGAYMTPVTLEKTINDPDFLIGLLTNLKEQQDKNRLLEEEAANNAPKVFFAEAVGESDNAVSIAELAKLIAQNGYEIGQQRLFSWLRENGYLIKRPGSDYNTPKQQYVEQGLFRIKKGVVTTSSGSKAHSTTRVTGKGQLYFVNKLLGVNNVSRTN